MNYLFVVAHPDDEVLGAGAFIHSLVKQGHEVAVCCITCKSNTRYDVNTDDLVKDMDLSHRILGIKTRYIGNYECMNLGNERHQEIVQFIERSIIDSKADYIFTHHPADLHNDHYFTSILCQEAARLPHRLICNTTKLKGLFYMEVQSSTDWCFNSANNKFDPDTFVPVTEEGLEAKIEALKVYNNVIRNEPHPRSIPSIMALAKIRGTECGEFYAESFQTVFRLGI